MKTLFHDQDEFNVLFVRKEIDDYGLAANEFRLYAHLARRAGDEGAWPSVESMARYCRLSVNTIRRCLRRLKEQNLIHATERPGFTTLYRLTSRRQWKSSAFQIHPSKKNRAPLLWEGSPPKINKGSTTKRRETKESHEGNPLKDNTVTGRLDTSLSIPSGNEVSPPSTPLAGGRSPDDDTAMLMKNNPDKYPQTAIRRKAYAIAELLRFCHWDNCKVRFVKETARAYAEQALKDGHEEKILNSAYDRALHYCHGVTTDEINRGKRHQHQMASPALTVYLARERLSGDPRTIEERWKVVTEKLTEEQRKIIEENAKVQKEIDAKTSEINKWFSRINEEQVHSASCRTATIYQSVDLSSDALQSFNRCSCPHHNFAPLSVRHPDFV
jgi:hypothetical protein